MNHYLQSQSEKILSCYLEKGGVGSGRRKNSIPELEESNFSFEVESRHKQEADKITDEDQRERQKRKEQLFKEGKELGKEINKLYKQIDGLKGQKIKELRTHGRRTQKSVAYEKVIEKLGEQGKELIKQYRQKEKEYNELND